MIGRLLLCTALLAAMAVVTPATAAIDNNWSIYLRATCSGGSASYDLLLGTMTGFADVWRSSPDYDANHGSPVAGKAEIGSGVMDGAPFPNFHDRASADRRAPLVQSDSQSNPKIWDLYTRINGGVSGSITIKGWVFSKLDGTDTVVELWKADDYGVAGRSPIWTIPPGLIGSAGSPNFTSDPINYTGTDILLKLVAYVPVAPSQTPEPGGIIALLVGLAGLGGFMRRQRA